MKISELREWAAVTYGSHSHKEGQVLAAAGPLEEWLGHLARQGINLEVVTVEEAAKLGQSLLRPLHAAGEPPTPLNSGGVSPAGVDVMEVPVTEVLLSPNEPSAPEAPKLDTSTFVDDTGFADEGASK